MQSTSVINLYYVKLSPKRKIYVVPLAVDLQLNWTVETLTTVTDKSSFHVGNSLNLQ